MTIEILYIQDCPNYLTAVERVYDALQVEDVSAEIKHLAVCDGATAMAMQFLGSPTVRVDGIDVEPSARSGCSSGLCCRTYHGNGGAEGAPSVALIRDAIRELIKPGMRDCFEKQ